MNWVAKVDHLGKCAVGQKLNSGCHETTYTGKVGFLQFSQLGKEEKSLLQWRCEASFKEMDTLCFHHEKIFLSRYESLQFYCANPWMVHKKKIKSMLNFCNF